MKAVEAQSKLTADGKGKVIIIPANAGTSEANLQVFLATDQSDALDGPYIIKAPGATEDDIIVPLKDVRAAVAVLSKVED